MLRANGSVNLFSVELSKLFLMLPPKGVLKSLIKEYFHIPQNIWESNIARPRKCLFLHVSLSVVPWLIFKIVKLSERAVLTKEMLQAYDITYKDAVENVIPWVWRDLASHLMKKTTNDGSGIMMHLSTSMETPFTMNIFGDDEIKTLWNPFIYFTFL